MEQGSLHSIGKIAVIGISGSGKSTLSRRLAKITGLPLFHMDLLFWKNNWEAVPAEKYLSDHHALANTDRWIIEGYVDKSMSERLKRAELILYLDYSGMRCFWRALKRMLGHHGKNRPELPEGCLDHFSRRFLWIILARGERKNMEAALEGVEISKVRRFHSPRELETYLKTVSGNSSLKTSSDIAPDGQQAARQNQSGSGIALGIAMGAAFGAAFDNIAIGIAIGVALGAAFESSRATRK